MVGKRTSLPHFHRLELLQAGLLCDLVLSFVGVMFEVTYIGYVADIAYLVAEMAQKLHEHIVCHSRSGMAEMRVSIYGRAADIKSHMTFIKRLEQLLLSRKRVGDI